MLLTHPSSDDLPVPSLSWDSLASPTHSTLSTSNNDSAYHSPPSFIMSALLVPAAQVLFWSTRSASASPIASSTFVPVQVGTPTSSPNFNETPASSGPHPTDGGGQGFSPPAVLWIVFCVLVGPPLITAGVRGWKVTSGVGNGLALAILCQYLAFPLHPY